MPTSNRPNHDALTNPPIIDGEMSDEDLEGVVGGGGPPREGPFSRSIVGDDSLPPTIVGDDSPPPLPGA